MYLLSSTTGPLGHVSSASSQPDVSASTPLDPSSTHPPTPTLPAFTHDLPYQHAPPRNKRGRSEAVPPASSSNAVSSSDTPLTYPLVSDTLPSSVPLSREDVLANGSELLDTTRLKANRDQVFGLLSKLAPKAPRTTLMRLMGQQEGITIIRRVACRSGLQLPNMHSIYLSSHTQASLQDDEGRRRGSRSRVGMPG